MTDFTVKYNQSAAKELTRGQLLKGYREKVIDKADVLALLQDLGYPQNEADYLIALEDYQDATEQQETAIKNIKLRFTENLLTSLDAQQALNKLNLPASRIALLMDKWELQRYANRKHPTKGDLEKMYLTGILSRDEYTMELMNVGFNTRYADLLRKLSDTKKK